MGYINPLDAVDFGTPEVHRFLNEKLDVPFTLRRVEDAATAGHLKHVRVGVANRYSRRMVLQWVESLGIQIDWNQAESEARHERADRAQREVAEIDAQLAKSEAAL